MINNELKEYLPLEMRKDYESLINQIELIKSKKKTTPHIIEFEGYKIKLYDEIFKFVLNKKNQERSWFDRVIRKIEYTVNNSLLDFKLILGLDWTTNIVVHRKVRRDKNCIKIIYLGSYMVVSNNRGVLSQTNALESDYVFRID